MQILAWDLNFIVFAILKLGQIMAEKVQRHDTRTGVQIILISVTPFLETLEILQCSRLAMQEFFLVFGLMST
jgi:hypothetical protein